MKKLVKITVMLLLFLGIVLTTNAQETKTYKYYTFAIAQSYDKDAEEGNRTHLYFSKIISRTYIDRINDNDYPNQYFEEEKDEFGGIWLKECKIRYDKKGEHWDWGTRVVTMSSYRGGGEDVAKENFCWSSTKKGAYKARQRYILDFKNHYSIDYKVHY